MTLKHLPTVKFNPNNAEHRAAARDFVKTGSFARNPFRFATDPNYSSIAEQVRMKLLVQYVKEEENEISK